jgi:hypothetical protein
MKLTCTKCGSDNINVQAISNVNGKTKGFGCIKSIFGTVIMGPIGFFCGLCGMGKGKTWTEVKTLKICQSCGHTF